MLPLLVGLTAEVNVLKTGENPGEGGLRRINEPRICGFELTVSRLVYRNGLHGTRQRLVAQTSRCRKRSIGTIYFLFGFPASHKAGRAVLFRLLFMSHVANAETDPRRPPFFAGGGVHPSPVYKILGVVFIQNFKRLEP